MVPKWVHDRIDQLGEGLAHGEIRICFQDGKVIQAEKTVVERERYCEKTKRKGER